ncbi:MAG: alpha-glucosidase C-terminal domain-containing protein [Bacteroidales bacterium]|jgi:glycosidase|nr:alpha-glucosidase C-terminal domain-containing protein [Bacteroidales bacterium]
MMHFELRTNSNDNKKNEQQILNSMHKQQTQITGALAVIRNLSFVIVLAFYGCNKTPDPAPKDDTQTVTVLPKHEVIYEVNVRNFSPQGNFAGVTAEIPRLKDLGIDILWLMPVHPIGVQNRTGTKGSPYSVKNYLEINPDFGTAEDLKILVTSAHQNKIKVLIDWVANHTAWDNVWVNEHIDYYATINGQRPATPAGQNWTDVVQLDYTNANLRTAMADAMKYWVQEFGIDGFRCDYVSGVPVSFWQQAKSAIDPADTLIWLAESDSPQYMNVFDYDYAWGFSDKLNLFGENKNVSALKNACLALFNNTNYANKSKMVYITNHDLNAYDGTEFTRFGANVFTMTVLFFTIYDMPLIYNGQELGINKSMGLFDVNKVPWTSVNQKMKTLVKNMIDLKHSQPALENGQHRGSLTFYNTDKNTDILSYSRKKENNDVLIILNLSGNAVKFKFDENAPNGTFSDWLSSNESTLEFSANTEITIAANGYQIWVKN